MFISSSTSVQVTNSCYYGTPALQLGVTNTSTLSSYFSAFLVLYKKLCLFVLNYKKREHFSERDSRSNASALIDPTMRVMTWRPNCAHFWEDSTAKKGLKKIQGFFLSVYHRNSGEDASRLSVALASADSCRPFAIEKTSGPSDVNNSRELVWWRNYWFFMSGSRRSREKHKISASCPYYAPVVCVTKTVASHWLATASNSTWANHVLSSVVLVAKRFAFCPSSTIGCSAKDRLCFWSCHSNYFTGA